MGTSKSDRAGTADRTATRLPPAARLRAAVRAPVEHLEGRTLFAAGDVLTAPFVAAVNGFNFNYRSGVVVQPDGKFLAAGYVNSTVGNGRDIAVARYNANGSLDTTYGTGGVASIPLAGDQQANAASLDDLGRVVVAGTTEAPASGDDFAFAVARFTTGGGADTSFSGDGYQETDFFPTPPNAPFSFARAFAVAIRPSSGDPTQTKIVVGGQASASATSPSRFALAQYNADGTLDGTFGTGGLVTDNAVAGTSDEITDLLIQPDNKIVASGTNRPDTAGSGTTFAVARYNPNGSRDTTFNGTGVVQTNFGFSLAEAAGVTLQSDGKLVVGGHVTTVTGSNAASDFAVARYNTNGTADTSFNGGTSNVRVIDFGGTDEQAGNVAIQTIGGVQKIVVSGSTNTGGGGFAVARLNPNGALDTTFDAVDATGTANDGKLVVASPAVPVGRVPALAVQNTTGPFQSTLVLAGVSTDPSNFDKLVITRVDANSVPTVTGGNASTVYVNDSWVIVTDTGRFGLSNGDTVTSGPSDTGNSAGISATFGVDAFSSVQAGIDSVQAGGQVLVLKGTYTENTTIAKNLSLLGLNGRAETFLNGVSNAGGEATIKLPGGTTAVQIGATGQGFTITGIENGNPASETAAIYISGNQSNTSILDNKVIAAGDEALLTVSGLTESGLTISNNEFAGQTFVGANPGVGDQFSVPNVPRPLVYIGGFRGAGSTTNTTFTNNLISGTAGGLTTGNQPSGNHLVSIDTVSGTITGNNFTGTTARFAGSLRTRGQNTLVDSNTFAGTAPFGLIAGEAPVSSPQSITVTNNTFNGTNSLAQLSLGNSGNAVTNNAFHNSQAVDAARIEFTSAPAAYSPPALYLANTFDTAVSVRDAAATPTYLPALFVNIQGGVNAAAATNIVHAYAGNYTENGSSVSVTKTLTLEGAQNGVDARTRNVPDAQEAVATSGFTVAANNVTLDGFLIDTNGIVSPTRGESGAYLSYLNSGYQVTNNIFRDNIFGLYFNSSGVSASMVKHNYFTANNRPGPAHGNGIYSDQGLSKATITENYFTGHVNGAITLDKYQGTLSDLTITSNQLVNDAGISLYHASLATVSSNTITGNIYEGVFVGGGDTDVSIQGNTFTDGASAAVLVEDVVGQANTNITVSGNTVNENIASLTAPAAMIDLRSVAGTNNVSGNNVNLTGTSAGSFAVTALSITNATGPVSLVNNNQLNGGGTAGSTGIVVSNVPSLNYTNNVIVGFTTGGSFTNIPTVTYTTSDAVDTFTVDATTMKDNGNQAISYSGVSTLNIVTLGSDDVVNINNSGASIATINADGGLGTNTINYNTDATNATADTVRFETGSTKRIYKPSDPNLAPGSQTSANTQQYVTWLNFATRQISTFGGNDDIQFVSTGGAAPDAFTINAGAGTDNVFGGLGDDTIYGNAGDDTINGNSGNDSLFGDESVATGVQVTDGNDKIFGGNGNDSIYAGGGRNQLSGQAGNDTFFARNGRADSIDGGAGLDSAQIDSGADTTSNIESLLA